MRESTGTGHTAGDHVHVRAILSAVFIVVLVYVLVLGQPFRFRRSGHVHTGGERFFGVNGNVTSFGRVTP